MVKFGKNGIRCVCGLVEIRFGETCVKTSIVKLQRSNINWLNVPLLGNFAIAIFDI